MSTLQLLGMVSLLFGVKRQLTNLAHSKTWYVPVAVAEFHTCSSHYAEAGQYARSLACAAAPPPRSNVLSYAGLSMERCCSHPDDGMLRCDSDPT